MIDFEIWKRITKHWCTKTYYWCWQATNLCLLSMKKTMLTCTNTAVYFYSKIMVGAMFIHLFSENICNKPNFLTFFHVKLWHLEDTITIYSVIFCLKEELWYLLCSTRRITTIWTYSDFSIMEDFIGSRGNCNNGRKYSCQNIKCKIYILDGNTCRKDFDFVTSMLLFPQLSGTEWTGTLSDVALVLWLDFLIVRYSAAHCARTEMRHGFYVGGEP
jgi:hypothetical protein